MATVGREGNLNKGRWERKGMEGVDEKGGDSWKRREIEAGGREREWRGWTRRVATVGREGK